MPTTQARMDTWAVRVNAARGEQGGTVCDRPCDR